MIRSSSQRVSGSLFGDASVYVVAAAVNAAIPFLLLPLIARWLGPADFGVIGGFVAIANVLVLLVGLNAYGFVSVSYYRDSPETLSKLVGAAVTVVLAASTVVGLIGLIVAGPVEQLTKIDRQWLWTLLAAATGQAILAIGLTVAQTIRQPFVYGAIQIGYGLSLAILALVLVGAIGMAWQGRALAQALAALMIAVGSLAWLRASGRVTKTVDWTTVRNALRFGIPLLPHSFAAVAMGSMDRLALSGSFQPSIVGQYFLALQISSVFIAFAAAVNQAWVPWLYERLARNDGAAWAEVSRAILIGSVLLVTGAAVMALLAKPLVLLVGGDLYLPAATPLRILAFYAACQAWYTLMSAFFFYGERTRLMSALTVSTALAQAALIVLFVRWGVVGVAGALLASSFAAAVAISLVARGLAADHRAAACTSVTGGAAILRTHPSPTPSSQARED
jgi:O-antigen/teichoic acid export membrane protein